MFWAGRYGVDEQLALAVAWLESGYQAAIVSAAGAAGPMQVTPDTRAFVEAVLVGMPIPHTTSGDVEAGVVYLRYLLRRFGGDERLARRRLLPGPGTGPHAHARRDSRVHRQRARAQGPRLVD